MYTDRMSQPEGVHKGGSRQQVRGRAGARLRTLTIGWVLSLVGWVAWALVGGGVAQAMPSSTTFITANVGPALEVVQWPSTEFQLGENMVPGDPVVTSALVFHVRSNASWGVRISSDNSEGKLREYETAGKFFVADGKTTLHSLEWSTDVGGPFTPLSSTPATLHGAQAPTGEIGRTVGFVLRFEPSFDDKPLTEPTRRYAITLTYTAGVGY